MNQALIAAVPDVCEEVLHQTELPLLWLKVISQEALIDGVIISIHGQPLCVFEILSYKPVSFHLICIRYWLICGLLPVLRKVHFFHSEWSQRKTGPFLGTLT